MEPIADNAIVVITFDTEHVRAGVAGENTPRVVFETPVGMTDATGRVISQSQMKSTVSRVFKDLALESGIHPVLVTCVANDTSAYLEALSDWMFNELDVPAMSMASDSFLAITAQADGGNGLVVHFAGTGARSTCVLDDRSRAFSVKSFSSTNVDEIASGVNASMQVVSETTLLCAHILLIGDVPPALPAALKSALIKLVPGDTVLNLIVLPEPQSAVWRTASSHAAAPGFEQRLITRQEYDENGFVSTQRYCAQ